MLWLSPMFHPLNATWERSLYKEAGTIMPSSSSEGRLGGTISPVSKADDGGVSQANMGMFAATMSGTRTRRRKANELPWDFESRKFHCLHCSKLQVSSPLTAQLSSQKG